MKLVVQLEIADHDGYCSGAECEYSSEIKTFEMPDNVCDVIKNLPDPKVNCCGSGYCNLSKECEQHNLDKHSHRYTVLHVES